VALFEEISFFSENTSVILSESTVEESTLFWFEEPAYSILHPARKRK
jgi:hypothetical protein